MKLHYKLAILAASFLLGACSTETLVESPDPGNGEGENDSERREVLLTLKNGLQLQPVGTRVDTPIATAEENYIESLDVYVFGSTTEGGEYTFQELHYYRDDAAEVTLPGVETYSFGLASGKDDATTTGLLKLKKGLFVKLYCIANRKELYQTAADGTTTQYTGFKSLLQSKPGQADNVVTAGAPTDKEFEKLHTALIDPTVVDATPNDVLMTPLPMTGAYTTPLDLTDFGSSARTQISFKLSRMVARFDIVNDAKLSKFTITKVSMGNGQHGASFFPIKTLVTDANDLITYPKRAVSTETQKEDNAEAGTTSVTKGAFYTWPSPKADGGYLILEGKYAVNLTENIDVSYRIPFQQVDNNNIGTYIEVAHNHRYTIGITKAEQYHLDFTLKVADWEAVEELDRYYPDNDFEKNTAIVLDAAASEGAYVMNNGDISVLPDAGSKFAFEMGSNTDLKSELIFKEGTPQWIEMEEPVVTRMSSQTTKYSFKVVEAALTDLTKLQTATIRLTNPASGVRKEIKVVIPTGPKISFTPEAGNYSTFDVATMTVRMYNVTGQTVKLHAVAETRKGGTAEVPTEITGSTAEVKDGDTWLTSSANVGTAAGDYTLTLGAKQTGSPLPSTTVSFASVASNASTTVTVLLKEAAMTPLTAQNFGLGTDNALDLTGGTGGIPKLTLNGVAANSVTISVVTPEGFTATVTGGATWLSASEVTNGSFSATIKDATEMETTPKTDGKITLTNILDSSNTFEIEVVTKVPVVVP